jgi:hypothetical protein
VQCGENSICDHLGARLCDGGKGFKAVHTLDTTKKVGADDAVRLLGVIYKTSAKDRGLLLNQCPWCGGQPGYFKRDAA